MNTLIGCLAHIDQSPAQAFQGPDHRSLRHALSQRLGPVAVLVGQPRRWYTHLREEAVAQTRQRGLSNGARRAAAPDSVVHRRKRGSRVVSRYRVEDVVGGRVEHRHVDSGHCRVEGRERIADRASASGHGVVDQTVVRVEPGVGGHMAQVVGHQIGAQQSQFEHLTAAPNGLGHLVRLGGGQYPGHVDRGLLQRLEQSVLGARREHVNLVEQVHLRPARGCESHTLQQLAHVVDLVVGGGVQFVQVERAVLLDGDA